LSLPRFADDAARSVSQKSASPQLDAELVARAAQGDASALANIWSRHHMLVKSVLLSTLGPDQEIDDLVQEVFLELLRAVKLVRDGMALPAILSRIAVRRAGMALRRRKVRSVIISLPWQEVPEVAVAPADVDSRIALAALYQLLDKIKTRHRLAFLLHFVQGLDVADVATALNVSLSTAKRAVTGGRETLIRLARRQPKLRQFLSEVGEER
jgi:RNA polymerase sigma-70 factor (ECF subfamily)